MDGRRCAERQDDIVVYALQSNPNIGQAWFPTYLITSVVANTSITLGQVIPDAYSITVSIENNSDLSTRVLIPEYEYTVASNVITINFAHAGVTYVGDANHTTTVKGISNYYKYQGTIVPSSYGLTEITPTSNFGSSIACDDLGVTIAVGAPTLGRGNVVVFSRIIENQYLQTSTSTVTPINPFSTISRVTVDGVIFPPSLTFSPSLQAGTVVQIEGFCFNVEQVITAPNFTDKNFGGSLAIQNNQLVVGSFDTIVRNQYSKGAGYLYALDTSISSSKSIPISDLTLSTTPFMINSWVISPANSSLTGLITAINNATGYTGVSAAVQGTTLILSVNPMFHTTGVGFLGV